jgi:hypothetical protein
MLEVADPGVLEDCLERQPVLWVKGEELVKEVQVGRGAAGMRLELASLNCLQKFLG